MGVITWKLEWNTGDEVVDEQHQILISLLNKIIERSMGTQTLLVSFIEYASSHFVDEEILMIKNNYPEELFLEHRREHRTFTRALLETSFGVLAARTLEEHHKIIDKLEEFCFIWFKMHFLNTDKKMVDFIKKAEVI